MGMFLGGKWVVQRGMERMNCKAGFRNWGLWEKLCGVRFDMENLVNTPYCKPVQTTVVPRTTCRLTLYAASLQFGSCLSALRATEQYPTHVRYVTAVAVLSLVGFQFHCHTRCHPLDLIAYLSMACVKRASFGRVVCDSIPCDDYEEKQITCWWSGAASSLY
jgi:hypothetical protein